jgi:GNAT superfamily N-acetyltransferase
MTAADLSLGLHLAQQAGWNQTEADWRRFLKLQPQGGFVAQWEGQPVGTVTTFRFGKVAWIATVLVDVSFRRRGIGTRLVEHALAHLDDHGTSTVRLDATEFGRPIYEQFGFTPEYELARFEGRAGGRQVNEKVQPLTSDLMDAAIELDRRVTGTDRRCLLEQLLQQGSPNAWTFVDDGELIGYAMVRRGRRAHQIGPAAAITSEAGQELLDQALFHCAGEPVFVDIPSENRMAVRWAENRGLRRQRRFVRMSRGNPVLDHPNQIWATSGPEKG